MRENFSHFAPPVEIQKESLCYSDGMGFESSKTFYINRAGYNNYLIMHVIEGQLICSQNGQNVAVYPKESVLLDLHQAHQYSFAKEIPSKIAWVHLNGSPIANMMEQLQKMCDFPLKFELPDTYSKILTLFQISDRPDQDIFQQSELCYSLLLDFFKEAWNQQAEVKINQRQKEFQNVMWHYISHNLHKDITIDELAGVASLSKYHFVRKFKEIFGMCPMHFVLNEKIRRAKYQLENTTEPICKISQSLAFLNPSYFSKVFKQAEGVTPSEYRKSIF